MCFACDYVLRSYWCPFRHEDDLELESALGLLLLAFLVSLLFRIVGVADVGWHFLGCLSISVASPL